MKLYDKKKELDRFLARLDKEKHRIGQRKKRIRRGLVTISGVAAAAVIAMFIYFSGGGPDKYQAERQVSLILSDGRSISLDDPQNDLNLIEETGTHIWSKDGTLIIDKNDEAVGEIIPNYYTLNVSEGYQYDIILEDKTHVWLNSGSNLRFPAAFAQGERRVFVEGEACFEVSKDADRPFIVETSGQTLTVLGTTFNLYAYPEEPVIYTTLLSGRVTVKSATDEITLSPNQSCGLNRNNNEFSVREVRAGTVADWRKGDIFIFEDNTLEQVLMKISRWYDVEIAFDDEEARTFVYKGNLPKYENVEDLLESLEMTGMMRFKKEKDRYVMIK